MKNNVDLAPRKLAMIIVDASGKDSPMLPLKQTARLPCPGSMRPRASKKR